MVDKIARYGIGLKPPSYHEMRVTFLNKEVTNVMAMLEEFKQEWKKTGCTIMSDGWSDRKRRSICNFLVNSPKGTVFLSSIDTSDISKTADKVLEMLDAVVATVGEENVVQLVTDNAANYRAAEERLMVKRKRLFWTPCAAHCIDLMLEDLDKNINVHHTTIARARKITTFIYRKTLLLTWMRDSTQNRELIRPGITRFATLYLTLRSLNEHKWALLTLFSSDKWKSSKFAKSAEGKKIQRIVLDTRGFWPNVVTCLRAALPLVKVLRMVDSDENPPLGFIYEAMKQTKIQIKANFNNIERSYKPVLDIISKRWADQLHKPLHATAYYLNPQYQYNPHFEATFEIKVGLYECLQRMVPDPEERTTIDLQMDTFKNAKGLFGLPTAVATRTKKTPADWWDSYGDECPELKRFAIRILSLTSSSSGCEQNWCTFEMVHTKKRKKLHQQKMNDLVFVMYNLKLKRIQEKRARMSVIQQPITLDEIPSDDEWLVETEEPALPSNGTWLADLDRTARRFARETTRNEDDSQHENDEILILSDDDGANINSNEMVIGEFGEGDDLEMGGTTTRTETDGGDDSTFGFDD